MKSANVLTASLGVLAISVSQMAAAQTGPVDPPPITGPRPFGLDPAAPTLPVDILPPGARALGLAGAFTAVADDATAAEANPAGLTILNQPEFSLHLRNSDFSVDFFDPEALDSAQFGGPSGDLIKTFDDSSSNISFVSFVKPFDRWVLSAFYGNQLDINASTPTEVSFDANFIDTFTNDNFLAAEVDGFGLSAAFRINDLVSVGITVKNTELDVSTIDSLVVEDFNDLENIFGDPSIGIGSRQDFANVINDVSTVTSSINGDDSDTVFNVGILVNPNGKWSFGAVYKEGASFSVSSLTTVNRQLNCVGSGTLTDFCNDVFDLVPDTVASFNNAGSFAGQTEIVIPDRLTLGLALRPSDTLLLSLDLNLVEYEDLPTPRRAALGFGATGAGQNLSDEIQYHLGVEKVFPLSGEWLNVFTLRGGVFEEKDRDGFRQLDTEDRHYTFGIGAVIRNLQLDLAYDVSDSVDNLVLSGIYRFD
ncbi:MAG: outer membrane protein transport protein [Lysobacterales bacterium]